MIRNIYEWTLRQLSNFFNSIQSIIFVLVFSKFKIDKYTKQNEQCIFMGNGPSLKDLLEKNLEFIKNKDIFVSNDFAKTKEFLEVKPNNYVIADPAYFNKTISKEINDRVELVYKSLNNVDWNITIYVPRKFEKIIRQRIINKNIIIKSFNHIQIKGYWFLVFFLLKYRLGMPRVQNVLVAILSIAINMKYDKIFLWGAEHSWMKYIVVNSKNQVCVEDHHFFSDKNKKHEPKVLWYNKDDTTRNMEQVLIDFSRMFKGYYILEKYATINNVKIINQTPASLIDAFDREN